MFWLLNVPIILEYNPFLKGYHGLPQGNSFFISLFMNLSVIIPRLLACMSVTVVAHYYCQTPKQL